MSKNDYSPRHATDVSQARRDLARARRIVIKIGSALLTEGGSRLASERIQAYGTAIAGLVAAGREVILVSSGAVAAGCVRLGWPKRPDTVHELQAAAAVGQMGLVQAYEQAMAEYDCTAAMDSSENGRSSANILIAVAITGNPRPKIAP